MLVRQKGIGSLLYYFLISVLN